MIMNVVRLIYYCIDTYNGYSKRLEYNWIKYYYTGIYNG